MKYNNFTQLCILKYLTAKFSANSNILIYDLLKLRRKLQKLVEIESNLAHFCSNLRKFMLKSIYERAEFNYILSIYNNNKHLRYFDKICQSFVIYNTCD